MNTYKCVTKVENETGWNWEDDCVVGPGGFECTLKDIDSLLAELNRLHEENEELKYRVDDLIYQNGHLC